MFIRVHPWLNFVQKKIKKNVDARLAFWQIGLTHGNNRTTTQNKMRTKTLLLSAAALLAAGIVSSQAQVYSQNIVGYASLPTAASTPYLMTVPFVIGASNGANEVWPAPGGIPTLPDFSLLALWNGNGYNLYYSDSGSPTLWDGPDSSTPVPAPLLPVGKAFFLTPNLSTTNVFAGTVAVNVGTSNVMTLAASSPAMVACVVPYAGAVTNGNPVTGAGGMGLSAHSPNGGLPDFSLLSIWNGNGYDLYYSDSGSPTLWDGPDSSTPVPAPTISVGQGFFLTPNLQFKWTVGL